MTKKDVGFSSPRSAIIHIILAALTLLIINFQTGLFSALAQLDGYLVAFLALIALAGLVFVWNLILAPWQLQKAADDRIADLENILDDREAQQNALNRLWALRSEGIAQRNEQIVSEAQFVNWERRYVDWRARVLDAAEQKSANLREWLRRLERMGRPPAGLNYYVGEDPVTGHPVHEHRRLAGIMTEILVRLQRHLEKDLT